MEINKTELMVLEAASQTAVIEVEPSGLLLDQHLAYAGAVGLGEVILA